jgi:hypothetical protein
MGKEKFKKFIARFAEGVFTQFIYDSIFGDTVLSRLFLKIVPFLVSALSAVIPVIWNFFRAGIQIIDWNIYFKWFIGIYIFLQFSFLLKDAYVVLVYYKKIVTTQ